MPERIVEDIITMNKKDKDIALFVAFCIEEYGAAKGMTGEQVTASHTRSPMVD